MASSRKRSSTPRARKPKAPPWVTFVPRFHTNDRAALACSCVFDSRCNGERLVPCVGDALTQSCDCAACGPTQAEHVTGCEGCENCLSSVCASCGKRDPSVPAVDGESWTCSPECTRKTFTVAT